MAADGEADEVEEAGNRPNWTQRRILGKGGCAVVWEARDEEGGVAAVKRFTGQHPQRAVFEIRVQRWASERVPGVPPVLDSGLEEKGMRGPWMAMRQITGVSPSPDFSRRCALRAHQQVARTLAGLHGWGLVHGDVKCGNVLWDGKYAWLLDFGLARTLPGTAAADDLGPSPRPANNTVLVVGTPLYMAPELAVGGEPQPASDVYALGCLLYWTLTGQRPYPTQRRAFATVTATLEAAVVEDLLMEVLEGLPRRLRELLPAMMARKPEERPDAAAVAGALRQAVRSAR